MSPGRCAGLGLVLLLAAPLSASPPPPAGDDGSRRIEREIDRLGSELQQLSASERGILGELNRLDAEARLRQAERERLDSEIGSLQRRIDLTETRLAQMAGESEEASRRLGSRLRALYRQGPLRHYRLMLSAESPAAMLAALRHASAIAASDAALVARVRRSRSSLEEIRSDLVAQRDRLVESHRTAEVAEAALAVARSRKQSLLTSIRKDRRVRSAAMEELKQAGSALADLSERSSRPATFTAPTFSRFQGLLPWPSPGRVASPFGTILHPRFQTSVPHDGIDIGAPFGADIRAIFDGKVSYASWLAGYGLTLLIDHGGGYMTVYAHASAILVEKGESVRQGELVAKVGDTGSLTGPILYFEIRKDGRPQNPLMWLKKR